VNDRKLARLAVIFSLLAIFIATLGLFGLVSYMIESRTREIGIRKVLGSSTPHMVYILIRSFVALIAISGVLAIPPTLFIMKYWFSHFAFRIGVPWWSFLAAIVLVMIIAFVTIIFQALRAAKSNVVQALRNTG
jgi:putative ABC transport system permease protein